MGDLLGQLDDLVADKTSRAEYKHELAISAFTNGVARVMDEQGVSQSELARRLGVSRARVSQLMQHTSSPTLRTMIEVATALGCEIILGVTRGGSQPARFIDPEAQRLADDEVVARRA
jgi:transcriptional regulator with XRE-family HTH domain